MKKAYTSALVAVTAVFLIITLLYSSTPNSMNAPVSTFSDSSPMEVSYVQSPEVFTVTPSVETIPREEYVLETKTSIAESSQRQALQSEIPNILAPLLPEAFAISPTANSVVLKEWTVPTGGAGVISTAYDPVRNVLWFPETAVAKIGRLNLTSNVITEYSMPTGVPVSFPLTVDSATGQVYFIESTAVNYNRIGRLDPTTGGITEWFLQCCGNGFANDRMSFTGGALWISSGARDNYMIRLNPTTNVETKWLIVPTSSHQYFLNAQPIADSSGNIWHVQEDSNTVNRLNPSTNQITRWPIPQPGSNPIFVSLDPTNNNNVYFAEFNGNRVARLAVNTNQITQWIAPTAGSGPDTVIVDSQGVLYFREYNAFKLGRLVASSNTITEWTVAGARAGWFSTDGDNIYFSEEGNGIKVGRIGTS